MTTQISLAELEDAVQYLSHFNESVLLLDLSTGNCVYDVRDIALDEIIAVDEKKPESGTRPRYIQIPDKYKLNIGRTLVLQFTREYFPEDYRDIFNRFKRPHAYTWWRIFLEDQKKLQEWHEFRNRKTKEALIDWCNNNHFEYYDDFAGGGKKLAQETNTDPEDIDDDGQ
jgi:hypothetical protein